MEEYEPETEIEENIEHLYQLSILDEEYKLSLTINESFLEFKLYKKNIIVDYYYNAKYDLQEINKLLFISFKEIKEVFNFFDKLLNDKEIKLIKLTDKNTINLNFKKIINLDKEIEINLSLKQIKFSTDEIHFNIFKEINSLKKKLDSKNEKAFIELIKENNEKLIKEKNNEIKSLKEIIIHLIKTDEDKQYALSILLRDYMQIIKSNNTFNDIILKEINEQFIFLKEKLIDPYLNNNNNLNLLKIINEHIGDEDNCSKLFCIYNEDLSYDKPLLTNENCKKYCEILKRLIDIFNKKISDLNYQNECKKVLRTIVTLIKKSKTKKSISLNDIEKLEEIDENENNQGIIFIYKLLYRLATENKNICIFLVSNGLIEKLINKLPDHVKSIRNIIYDIILYLLKQLDEYNKSNFNLFEDEKEGQIHYNPSYIFSSQYIRSIQTIILYNERPEILTILYTIISKNNSDNISEITEFIEQIFSKYENTPKKLYPLLDIISSLIQLNDQFTFKRLIEMAGYPSLVVKPIPKDENWNNLDNSSNEFDSESNDQNIKGQKSLDKQKWPLFGERLIDGNINREIYEYLISDHNKSYKCLLAILFPSEYRLLDINKKTIKISEEKKKEILTDMIKSIFNNRNNYPLFKYLYLMPSRSLLNKNLYSEIISYLDIYNNNKFPCSKKEVEKKRNKLH